MRKFRNFMIGSVLFTSGLLVADAQAFMGLGQTDGNLGGDSSRLVILVHNCHSDCQQGNQGVWHKHGFKKCGRKSCPRPNRSQVPLELPDGSLINLSPLPSSEKVQQQTH